MIEHLEHLINRLERRVISLEADLADTDRRAREALDDVRRLEDRLRYLEQTSSY